MKRTMLSLFVLAIAAPVVASESFTLDIPQRFNANQETGEVRVTLNLSAAPAGAQLVVNNATTLNLGDTTTVAGDSVAFTAGSGNSVMIRYQPLSNFGADFCAGGGAVEKMIPMRFSGAQDVVEYRVTTYVVAAPDVECSKASKRTGDAPATLIATGDGVAPALSATNRGRHPLDVVLVLDKSGSMAELPPGSDPTATGTKAEILKSALDGFLASWREIDQPTMSGGEWSQDRIGVVFFDSTAAAQSITGADPPANFFVQRGVDAPGPTHKWNAVQSTVDSLTPGGSTAIGAGINQAMSQWQSDPAHDLFLITVTDGKQNTAPLIQPAASGHLGITPVAGFPEELRKRFIPIQTIAFGTPDTVDDALLKNISLETSGVSYITLSPATMFDVFGSTLVAILKGNTASIAMRRHGTMSGAGPTASQPVVIDRSAQRVVFALQWAPPLRAALDLEVFRPGSSVAATPTSSENTPQGAFQTFDIAEADAGTWSVRVKRNNSEANTNVPYTLNVFFLERHLDYRIAFENAHAATGDTIRVRATVAWDGKPLANLPAGAIRVRIQRPSEGLGTILHNTPFADNGGTSLNGDTQTPYDRKVAALTNAALLDRVVAKDVATISLTDQKNGIYTGTFDQTSVPGTYGFEVLLDWDDARTGHVRREERLEQHMKVKPDAARTEITTSRNVDGKVLVSVTPRDRFGNYLGPGYGTLVQGTLRSTGTLTERVDRDQTGTYIFTVSGVPAAETPDLDIVVDGVSVGKPSTAPSSSMHRFFIGAGANVPDGGFSVNASIEWLLSPVWSVEGIIGHHDRDEAVTQLSIAGRRYFGASAWQPFINAGVGAYHTSSTTKGGVNVGAGVLYKHIEAAWNHHSIASEDFSTFELGVRFNF